MMWRHVCVSMFTAVRCACTDRGQRPSFYIQVAPRSRVAVAPAREACDVKYGTTLRMRILLLKNVDKHSFSH